MADERNKVSTPIGSPDTGMLARWRMRLRNRLDSEHEQALVRLVLVGLLILYFGAYDALASNQGWPGLTHGLAAETTLAAAYFLISLGYVAWIIARPAVSHRRRLLAMVTDLTMLALAMHLGGPSGGPLYIIFLWVTFGNGFRFGNAYLAAASLCSVVTFGTMIAFTPFWLERPTIAMGLLFGLIALPAYVATLIRKLWQAKRAAEEASHAKSRFLATMSHELRTPLNAVIGLAELLRASRLDPEQSDMARTIASSGRMLLSQINDILDLAKIEEGKATVSHSDFELAREVSTIVAMLRAQAEEKGLTLALCFDADVPAVVRGDAQKLRQMLINLISNGVKFTQQGGVLVRVSRAAASDHATGADESKIRFRVEDTGLGISEEDQARIFEAFTQTDSGQNRRHGGTGLGLTIVRQFAERLGGEVGVSSVANEGSAFDLILPLPAASGWHPGAAERPRFALRPLPSATPAAADLRDALATSGLGRVTAGAGEHGLPDSVPVFDLRGQQRPSEQETASLLEREGSGRLPVLLISGREDLPRETLLRTRATVRLRDPLDALSLRTAAALVEAIMGDEADPANDGLQSRPERQGHCVLLVEDNPVNRKVISRIVETAGYQVEAVDSGMAALDRLDERDFDCVLMDVNMPHDSGIETVKLYRFSSLGGGRQVPIVAVTADATVETRQACLDAGMDDFISKPVDPARLLETIDRLVLCHAQAQAAADPAVQEDGATAHSQEAPILDQVALGMLFQLDHSGDFAVEVVQDFLIEAADLLGEIELAHRRGMAGRVQDLAHAIKSAAGYVGAARMRDAAAHVFETARARPASLSSRDIERIAETFEVYQREVLGYLKRTWPNSDPLTPRVPSQRPRVLQ